MSRSRWILVLVVSLIALSAAFPAAAFAGDVVHTRTTSSHVISPVDAIGAVASQLRDVKIGAGAAKVTMEYHGVTNHFTVDYGELLSSVERRAADGKDGGLVRLMLLPFAASFVTRVGGLLTRVARV